MCVHLCMYILIYIYIYIQYLSSSTFVKCFFLVIQPQTTAIFLYFHFSEHTQHILNPLYISFSSEMVNIALADRYFFYNFTEQMMAHIHTHGHFSVPFGTKKRSFVFFFHFNTSKTSEDFLVSRRECAWMRPECRRCRNIHLLLTLHRSNLPWQYQWKSIVFGCQPEWIMDNPLQYQINIVNW